MMPVTKTWKPKTLACATLLSSALLGSAAMAADAVIPTSLVGTYDLSYANAQTGAPVPNGTPVEVIITQGGAMCIAGFTLTGPTESASGSEAIWVASDLDIKVAVSNLSSGTFNEINLATASTNVWLGQLVGSRASNSTSGCEAGPDLTDINELFAQAEAHFADLFPGSVNVINQTLDQYIYRYYPTTQLYLGIADGQVYVMGGAFGNNPAPQGSLEDLLSQLAGEPVDLPDVPELEGDYRLVVDGTVAAQVGGFATPAMPFSFTIDKVAAPSSSDIDDIREAVE